MHRIERACGSQLFWIHHDFHVARFKFFHAALEHDAAAIDEHEIGEHVLNLFNLMRGHDDRSAAIEIIVQQRMVKFLPKQKVQAKRRFVEQFYDSLLNDYFDRSRTIVVTTHQVEEVQDVLTDLMFIDRGRIVLECSMEEFEARYLKVLVTPDHLAAARALKPMHER